METYIHRRKSLWSRTKLDFSERFLKFETFNGLLYLLWGWGFFFYGFPWEANSETFLFIITQPQFGYNYALMSVGIMLMVWGVRKITVNRVKQALKMEQSVALRKAI